jgi:hypothetical protein
MGSERFSDFEGFVANPEPAKGHRKDHLSGLGKSGLVFGSAAISSPKRQIAYTRGLSNVLRYFPIRLAKRAWGP